MGVNNNKDYARLFNTQDVNQSSEQQVKCTGFQESNKSSIQDFKSRVRTDHKGKTRRPVNITMTDETKLAFDIMAATKRVKVWLLIDEALREYIQKHSDREQEIK